MRIVLRAIGLITCEMTLSILDTIVEELRR
jgi:hypothetical protein